MTRHDKNRSTFIEPFESADELSDESAEGQLSAHLIQTADENKDKKVSLDELARHLARQK